MPGTSNHTLAQKSVELDLQLHQRYPSQPSPGYEKMPLDIRIRPVRHQQYIESFNNRVKQIVDLDEAPRLNTAGAFSEFIDSAESLINDFHPLKTVARDYVLRRLILGVFLKYLNSRLEKLIDPIKKECQLDDETVYLLGLFYERIMCSRELNKLVVIQQLVTIKQYREKISSMMDKDEFVAAIESIPNDLSDEVLTSLFELACSLGRGDFLSVLVNRFESRLIDLIEALQRNETPSSTTGSQKFDWLSLWSGLRGDERYYDVTRHMLNKGLIQIDDVKKHITELDNDYFIKLKSEKTNRGRQAVKLEFCQRLSRYVNAISYSDSYKTELFLHCAQLKTSAYRHYLHGSKIGSSCLSRFFREKSRLENHAKQLKYRGWSIESSGSLQKPRH